MERIERHQLTKEEFLSELIREAADRTAFFRNLPEGRQERFLGSVGRVVKFAVDKCSLTDLRDAPKIAFMECGAEELLRDEKQSLSAELPGANRRMMGQAFGSAVHVVLLSYAGGFPTIKERIAYWGKAGGMDDAKISRGASDHSTRRKRW